MEKIKIIIIILIGIFLIFYSLLGQLINYLSYKQILLISLFISILILYLYRNNLEKLKTSIKNLYFSLSLAGFINFPIALISLNEIFPKTKIWVWIIITIVMFLILLSSIYLIFRNIIRSGYILIALFFLNIGVFYYYYTKSISLIKETEKELTSIGYSFDLEKIFPLKNSKVQCQEWLEKAKILNTHKWENFYNKYLAYFLSNEYFVELFKNNEILECEIEESELNEFFEINKEIISEMEKCPYLQLIDVEKYLNKIYTPEIGIFPIIIWAKFLFSFSQILMLNEEQENAKKLMEQLNDIYEKINNEGKTLTFLISSQFFQQKIILNNASFIKIYKKPMEATNEELIKNFAKDDLSSTFNSLFIDFLPMYYYIKELKFLEKEKISKFKKETLKFTLPALGYGFSKYYISFWYERLKLKKEVNTAENKFAWEEYKKLPQKSSLFLPNISRIYVKALLTIAQARALYISNEVFKYFKINNKLPEDLKFLESNLKIDPFTEKEFIYKKEGEKKFKVYSIGPDGEDNGGENLYYTGPLKIYEKLKQNIGFILNL